MEEKPFEEVLETKLGGIRESPEPSDDVKEPVPTISESAASPKPIVNGIRERCDPPKSIPLDRPAPAKRPTSLQPRCNSCDSMVDGAAEVQIVSCPTHPLGRRVVSGGSANGDQKD